MGHLSDFYWTLRFNVRWGEPPCAIKINDGGLWIESGERIDGHMRDANDKRGGDVGHCVGAV